MRPDEAEKIIKRYYENGQKESDEPAYVEALGCLGKLGSAPSLSELGGYYYGKRNFYLALKYYTLASELGDIYALIGLGYIWYYGRTGQRNYEKAFNCFNRAIELLVGADINQVLKWEANKKIELYSDSEYDEYINAVYKIADMYRTGHYVKKDYTAYEDLILHLYFLMEYPATEYVPNYHMPEIRVRLGNILVEDPSFYSEWTGEDEGMSAIEALDQFSLAKDEMKERLYHDRFFGNFSIMKSIVNDIFSLMEGHFEEQDLDLYDMYYILEKPCRVTFTCNGSAHILESEQDGQRTAVCLDGTWFRNADDFMKKAVIDGDQVPIAYDACHDFKVSFGG